MTAPESHFTEDTSHSTYFDFESVENVHSKTGKSVTCNTIICKGRL
jgi:hypothetical protein